MRPLCGRCGGIRTRLELRCARAPYSGPHRPQGIAERETLMCQLQQLPDEAPVEDRECDPTDAKPPPPGSEGAGCRYFAGVVKLLYLSSRRRGKTIVMPTRELWDHSGGRFVRESGKLKLVPAGQVGVVDEAPFDLRNVTSRAAKAFGHSGEAQTQMDPTGTQVGSVRDTGGLGQEVVNLTSGIAF